MHVVNSTISIGNQQSLSGTLRMQSSPTESLVVKLLGTNVDIVAGGELLDIADRTGGSLQIVGTPGHAVVLTSLKDDTVGAGLTPQGHAAKRHAQPQRRRRSGARPTWRPRARFCSIPRPATFTDRILAVSMAGTRSRELQVRLRQLHKSPTSPDNIQVIRSG